MQTLDNILKNRVEVYDIGRIVEWVGPCDGEDIVYQDEHQNAIYTMLLDANRYARTTTHKKVLVLSPDNYRFFQELLFDIDTELWVLREICKSLQKIKVIKEAEDCADCGRKIVGDPFYWMETSARCAACHEKR